MKVFFTALMLVFFLVSVSFAKVCPLHIIAQTGTSVGAGTPVALGPGPSINDSGKVAFVARDQADSRGRVVVINQDSVEKDFPIGTPATVDGYVQINNSDQVVFWQGYDNNLISYIKRLDTVDNGQVISSGSRTIYYTGKFLEVLTQPMINNNGRGVFSAIGLYNDPSTSEHTYIGTRDSGEGEYGVSPPLTGYPNMYPMISDNNRTVVRGGESATAPVMVFIDTTLDPATAFGIATSADFNAMGKKPGISDDGNVVAFVGDHKTQGLGIYISVLFPSGITEPFKISGIGDLFSNFSLSPRVAVNSSDALSLNQYTIVYMGWGAAGKMGLYTSIIDISDPLSPTVLNTSLIVEVDDEISGLSGQINNIMIHDPINNNGQIACWVHTTTDTQAIICKKSSPIEAIDPNPMLLDGPNVCDNFDNLGGDLSPHVVGLTADGCTKIVLRVETSGSGTVEFAVKDDYSELNDVGTLSSPGNNEKVMVLQVNCEELLNGKYMAFAVLEAPDNFVRNSHSLDQLLKFRNIYVQAVYHPENNEESSHYDMLKLELHRPPVILFHGWTGSPKNWDWDLNKEADLFTVSIPDYNHRSWQSVDKILYEAHPRQEINNANESVRNNYLEINKRIASTRVDVFAHSMGGLVFRKYISGPTYKRADYLKRDNNFGMGDIHKLITVDTPHQGSPFANKVVDSDGNRTLEGVVFENKVKFSISDGLSWAPYTCLVCGGAFDLRTDSPLINNLKTTIVPAHAIVGVGGSNYMNSILWLPMKYGKDAAFVLWGDSLKGNNPFQFERHDLIVGEESQTGQLTGSQISLFDWINADNTAVHATVVREDRVRQKAIELLNARTDSVQFAAEFPGTAQNVDSSQELTYDKNDEFLKKDNTTTSAELMEGLFISSPSSGMVVLAGNTINVVVEPVNGFVPRYVMIADKIFEEEPYVATITIPETAIGQAEFLAFAYDDEGNAAISNSVVLEAVTAANLTEIEIQPDHIYLHDYTPNKVLTVIGRYEDGVERDLTSSIRGTAYEVADPSILSVDTEGFITAISKGTTQVTAANNTLQDSVEVTILGVYVPLDADQDGLNDQMESSRCTDIYDADTDNDGIIDGDEDSNRNGVVDPGETDPCKSDTDGDGVQDGTEIGLALEDIGPDTDTGVFQPDLDNATTTDPLDSDSDGDGASDGIEDANHNGRVDAGETDPNPEDVKAIKAMPWIPLLLLDE